MTRRLALRILPLTLFLIATLAVRAERLPVTIYTSADGLGSGFIDFLMRDSRGFMWFCTRDGLSRFDGARFVTYRISDKNGPPGIESLYQTRDGTYWITTTGGLYRFKADAVSQPTDAVGDRPFLNADFVMGGRGPLLEDAAGNFWYASDDLYRIKNQNEKAQLEATHLDIPATPNHPFGVFQLREAADGCIWLNTNQGLVRRFPDGRRILYQHETPVRTGLASMVLEPNGRVWVIWRNDFFVINPTPIESVPNDRQLVIKPLIPTSIISTKPGPEVELPNQPDEVIRLAQTTTNPLTGRLYKSRDNHIWLIADKNLLEFDGRRFVTHGSTQGLPAGMGEMAEDSAGNLWIGGRTALVRLDRKGLVSYGETDGLGSSNIESIVEGGDGTLYFVNGDFTLSRSEGQRFQSTRPQIASDARALWTSRAAFLSTANEWWILTTTKLYRFAGGNLQQPLATYDSKNGLKADDMFQMFEDSHGNLWLSQQPNNAESYGLYRMQKKGFCAVHAG